MIVLLIVVWAEVVVGRKVELAKLESVTVWVVVLDKLIWIGFVELSDKKMKEKHSQTHLILDVYWAALIVYVKLK